jgi:hypothetical protein
MVAVAGNREPGTSLLLNICEPFKRGAETHAAVASDQSRTKDFRFFVGVGPGKSARRFLVTEERTNKGIRKICMLIGGQLALPGSVTRRVGTDRPEIGPAADKPTIAQDDHAAVTAFHAVKHVNVDRIESVPHNGCQSAFVAVGLYPSDRPQATDEAAIAYLGFMKPSAAARSRRMIGF